MNLPNVRRRNIQFRTGRLHRIFFGLRRAGYRWSKAGAKALLAVKCCIENNREATSSIGGFAAPPSDQKNWNAAAVLPLLRSVLGLLGDGCRGHYYGAVHTGFGSTTFREFAQGGRADDLRWPALGPKAAFPR